MTADPTILRQYEMAYGPFVHMSQEEKSIWLRFLIQGGTGLAPFRYDVRVGNGLQLPAGSSGYAVRSALALTTKRIDVLWRHGDTWIICEVKRRAGAGAVGQLITYRDLFLKTPGITGPATMFLLTDELQPDMIPVLESSGIKFSEVGL